MIYTFKVTAKGDRFIAPHFRLREFAQTGHDIVIVNAVALMALNNFRQAVGRPVRITSAYRTKEHNAKVGGVPTSLHREGSAFDIKVRYDDAEIIIVMLKAAGFNEVIFYPDDDHFHVAVERAA